MNCFKSVTANNVLKWKIREINQWSVEARARGLGGSREWLAAHIKSLATGGNQGYALKQPK